MQTSDPQQQFETWAGALLAKVDAASRRKLASQIGTAIRRSQIDRIRTQRNPDGSGFAPRKKRPAHFLRSRRGAIRRKSMFQRLASTKQLRVMHTADGVAVGFLGRVARIARVHQEGLRDDVAPGKQAVYPVRQLLGFTDADRSLIREILLEHLAT